MNADEIVATVWQRHRIWSAAAGRLKSGIVRWRSTALLLGAAGAVLQTLAATMPASAASTTAAVLGAVALVIVPIVTSNFLTGDRIKAWLRARSVSEGIKSEAYRFRTRAEPYADGDAARLRANCRKMEVWADTLATELAKVAPDAKPPPAWLQPDDYLKRRINDQVEAYYRPEARRNASLADGCRWLSLGLSTSAALLGAVAAALKLGAHAGTGADVIGAWIAVLTTLGASVIAHAAASRFTENARSYFATARQLEDLRDDWIARGRPGDVGQWSAFVAACEETISAENRAWMAKMDPEEDRASVRNSAAATPNP